MATIENKNSKADVGQCLALIKKLLYFASVRVPQGEEFACSIYLDIYLDGRSKLRIRIAGIGENDLINTFARDISLLELVNECSNHFEVTRNQQEYTIKFHLTGGACLEFDTSTRGEIKRYCRELLLNHRNIRFRISHESADCIRSFGMYHGQPLSREERAAKNAAEQGELNELEELYKQAVNVVFQTQSPSVVLLQQEMKLSYLTAARLMCRMEEEGVVSPYSPDCPRRILISKKQWESKNGGSKP